jgi:hypothetical protein
LQRLSSSLPWHPIPPYHSSVPVRACMRRETACASSQQKSHGELSRHTGSGLAVAQKTRRESRLGWRRPVAVGWRWRWTLCAHASLSGAAGRRRGQGLCNHYSTAARQSETQRSGIPSSCWVPASGLLVSGVVKEARGTGEEGAWAGARAVRNGLPDDMVQSGTMHCSMYREELGRSGVSYV